MKRYKWFFLIVVSGVILSCTRTSEEELVGDWQLRADFPRSGRCHAATFVIDNKGYVISGFNGYQLRPEVVAFDHVAGAWTELSDLPGHIPVRQQAVGFSLKKSDGKSYGYIGTGWCFLGVDRDSTLRDFWQYDPESDTWEEAASLPAAAQRRRGAIAFSLKTGNKEYGFVGCGYSGEPDGEFLQDFWKFDPNDETDGKIGKWTRLEGYGGRKRAGAMAFVVDNKAYICLGENPNNVTDFWRFDPNAEGKQWESDPPRQMTDANKDEDYDDDYFGKLPRAFGVAYVAEVGGELRGHVVGGKIGSGFTNWEYNHHPVSDGGDLWVQRTHFYNNVTQQTREGMISFSFPNTGRAFAGMGKYGMNSYLDDLWEFKPLIEDYTYNDYK